MAKMFIPAWEIHLKDKIILLDEERKEIQLGIRSVQRFSSEVNIIDGFAKIARPPSIKIILVTGPTLRYNATDMVQVERGE